MIPTAASSPGPAHAGPGGTAADVLVVSGLSKTFGGVRALRDAALTVRAGEVHGLVGENGSGKSTMIKVLAGFHTPDTPTAIEVCGTRTELPLKPGEASRLGIAFVHQDLGLIPDVSVLENLLIDDFATQNDWRISWREQRRRAREILERNNLPLDIDQPVAELRPTERALLAIARAAEGIRRIREADGATGHGLLVLDEPTVYLPEHDRKQLFSLMHAVAQAGVGIIFVSHDVDEVLGNTDRVTVMRDGQVAGTVQTAATTPEQLIGLILGREFAARAAAAPPPAAPEPGAGFRIEGLSGRGTRGLSVEIRRGEILGLTGLPGAGFDDVPYLLFGAETPDAGVLEVDGARHDLTAMTPGRAIKLGMALIPADRPGAGAVGSLPVVDNVSLQILPSYRRGPSLSRRQMVRDAEATAEKYDVRPRDPRLDYSNLSGGNQQKVLLAKWMLTEPTLVLLHEPTQGVDIGAREEIFELLRGVAAEGCSIVVASSDHEQLAAVCTSVAIVRSGHVSQQLRGDDLTQSNITDACYTAEAAA